MQKKPVLWGYGLLLGLLLLGGGTKALAASPTLISGEWPPYTGEHEPQGGTIAAVVRQAFARQGASVNIGVFPWARVQRMIRFNRSFIGKFPVYYSADRASECHLSKVIGESPLGLAERKTNPIKWQKVEDFLSYRVGVVGTYENTPEFDNLVTQGKVSAVVALDDEENIKNLQQGLVDVIIIDRNVFYYLVQKKQLQSVARQLQLNPAIFTVHKLHVCFQKTEEGKLLRDQFDTGLQNLMTSRK